MADASYLSTAQFKDLTLAPASYVDYVEAQEAGWCLRQLTQLSRWIDSRLRKRYAAPFSTPYPETVTQWLSDLMTFRLYLKRGVDPTDAQIVEIQKAHDVAKSEILEAATAVGNAFELPLRADNSATATSKGGVLGYSEASPYTFTIVQADAARGEDDSGRGS